MPLCFCVCEVTGLAAWDDEWKSIQEKIREDRKQAEHYLLCYRQELAQYQQEKDQKTRDWLKAVEMVTDRVSGQKADFLRLRREAWRKHFYYRGKETWVPYVQQRYRNIQAEAGGRRAALAGERTLRLWWRELVSDVANVHIRIKNK